MYLVSRTFYGPQILSIFYKSFFAILRNFPCKNQPGENPRSTHNLLWSLSLEQPLSNAKMNQFDAAGLDGLKQNLTFPVRVWFPLNGQGQIEPVVWGFESKSSYYLCQLE